MLPLYSLPNRRIQDRVRDLHVHQIKPNLEPTSAAVFSVDDSGALQTRSKAIPWPRQ